MSNISPDFAIPEAASKHPAESSAGEPIGSPDLPSRLTREELAALWRVTVRTIERWVATGACPSPIRIGGRVLFRREDVLAWEAGRRRARED